jgi:hypothetical protein
MPTRSPHASGSTLKVTLIYAITPSARRPSMSEGE